LVPYLSAASELKTKPTQHSVKELRSLGINPDVIVLRTHHTITKEMKQKVSLFCSVHESAIIEVKDADIIYEVPLALKAQKLDDLVCKHFNLDVKEADMTEWTNLIETIKNIKEEITIALVGKYTSLQDAYLSVIESINHAGHFHKVKVNIEFIDASDYASKEMDDDLKNVDGILVPGGFGERATIGKMKAIKYARENNIPFLGLCYGMQLATIEFMQNVVGIKEANSTEIDALTKEPVFHLLENQTLHMDKGGTLRLGAYECHLIKGLKTHEAYGIDKVNERHRHRYEFNNHYKERMEAHGLKVAGVYEPLDLVEIIELENHPFFIATQFHPEFKSRPLKPHPLFEAFIKHAKK